MPYGWLSQHAGQTKKDITHNSGIHAAKLSDILSNNIGRPDQAKDIVSCS
jgi:hypothetical protein